MFSDSYRTPLIPYWHGESSMKNLNFPKWPCHEFQFVLVLQLPKFFTKQHSTKMMLKIWHDNMHSLKLSDLPVDCFKQSIEASQDGIEE